MSTDNMRVHLDYFGRQACNNFTSSDIKLSKDISKVDCNSCRRTIKYRQVVKAKCLIRKQTIKK